MRWKFADSEDDDKLTYCADAFDNANGRRGVAWSLTIGLYWSRTWSFLSLDNNSQTYVNTKLSIQIGLNAPKKRCN
jgi:5-methylcytosine-specific restriction enzyme B